MQGKGWDPGSQHLLQWLNLLDTKTSYLGGRHLLSEPALQVVRKPSVEMANDGDSEGLVEFEGSTVAEMSSDGALQTTKPTSTNRLRYLLSTPTSPAMPSSIVRMDILNIILHPALQFHLTSQAFSRRIGGHDRHHRTRGTPEDESEVMAACMNIEQELQELWRRRPGILNITAKHLEEFVSSSIARRLEQLFSVYIATFWTHFIYIHRVAYWDLKHTPIVTKAIHESGRMMRRSIGQPEDQPRFDRSIPRTSGNVIHPGLMWPCFMFGCEATGLEEREWAVLQLGALGKLDLGVAGDKGDESVDRIFSLCLDQKGAQNSLKMSRLLQLLISRQEREGKRVDGKYLSQEIFGYHFYII